MSEERIGQHLLKSMKNDEGVLKWHLNGELLYGESEVVHLDLYYISEDVRQSVCLHYRKVRRKES